MDPQQLLLPDPSKNPREWIAAAHEYFRQLNEQDTVNIIATFESLRLIECSAGGNTVVMAGIKVIKDAAKARMQAIMEEAPNGTERHRMALIFFKVTGDSLLL